LLVANFQKETVKEEPSGVRIIAYLNPMPEQSPEQIATAASSLQQTLLIVTE
jgi:hypothetical protein